MPNDNLRARLEALNRKPLKHAPSEHAESRRLESTALDTLTKGLAIDTALGACYLIETELDTFDAAAHEHQQQFPRLFPPYAAAVGRAANVPHATAPKTLFLDLETLGLATQPIFLLGTLVWNENRFVAQQYLARTRAEEPGLLATAATLVADAHLLVTFNGDAFDVPYLQGRVVAAGLDWREPDGRLDLLKVSRRRFRRRIPNHKLQTLERLVCGRHREDDIAGAQIPRAYRRFLRDGDARMIRHILDHNLHDLVTMMFLMNHLFGY